MVEFVIKNLLTLIIFTPTIGAALILILAFLIPRLSNKAVKIISFFATLIPLLLCIFLFMNFDRSSTYFQFMEKVTWIQAFNIEYFVAVDGISVTMVLLTALLSFICIFASWNIEDWKISRGAKGYFMLFLVLETGMLGVFCALDFFLFYVFWEIVLFPMYFLIGIWGGPKREYAAIKFFLYTLVGSVLMLVVMLAMYFTSDIDPGPAVKHTFDLTWFRQNSNLFTGVWWFIAFIALYIGFAIKVPVFPFHTWLPDAHVEAPTPISVILAGILLKMGTYGLMRISYPILPEATRWFAPVLMVFGFVNIVYGALCSMAQIKGVPRIDPKTGERYIERDWKKLIAYSSVSHMGYCLIGMAACTSAGMQGALFEMWNHGIITGCLFLIVGVIYDRVHHRDIGEFGGIWSVMPYYGGITALMFMASLGLPGLAGFISEILCFIGAFQAKATAVILGFHFQFFKVFTALSVSGIVLGAGYFLWSYQKVFLGPLNPRYAELKDISLREVFMLVPLGAITVILGVFPSGILSMISQSLNELVRHVGMPWIGF